MSEPTVLALYAQLLGIGVLWVSVHCSGMCGPIIAGLVVSSRTEGASTKRSKQAIADAGGVLLYQGGRALTYILLGATAGLLGSAVEGWVQGLARTSGVLVAIALIIFGFLQFPDIQGLRADLRRIRQEKRAKEQTAPTPPKPPASARAVAKLFRMLPSKERFGARGRMFISGVILGLLPCSLMFWVLSLSAASASPLHGAGLMLTLIALTTPVLLIAGTSSGLLSGRWRRAGAYAIPIGMIFSGFWLGLIAAAANGWIPHAGVDLNIGGKEYMWMLW